MTSSYYSIKIDGGKFNTDVVRLNMSDYLNPIIKCYSVNFENFNTKLLVVDWNDLPFNMVIECVYFKQCNIDTWLNYYVFGFDEVQIYKSKISKIYALEEIMGYYIGDVDNRIIDTQKGLTYKYKGNKKIIQQYIGIIAI